MLISLGQIEPPQDQDIKHRQENTIAFVKSANFGKGTLFVAQSRYYSYE